MIYRILHTTCYDYSKPVTRCHNEVRMMPVDGPCQKVLETDLVLDLEASSHAEHRDFFGNRVVYFEIHTPHQKLSLTAKSKVDTKGQTLDLNGVVSANWEEVHRIFHETNGSPPEIYRFLLASIHVPLLPEIREYAALSFPQGRPMLEAMADLNQRIFSDFTFDVAATDVSTPLLQAFRERRGVCQDFSHFAIACMRTLGFPAAYVSGYLETDPPDGQIKLKGTDASHAWFAVYVPEAGWIHFDPTNNQMADRRYIHAAMGRDYAGAAPSRGVVFGGGVHQLSVSVDVVSLPASASDTEPDSSG